MEGNKQFVDSLNGGDWEGQPLKLLRLYAQKNGVPILHKSSACLLKTITSVAKPDKILEIGTAIGYSGMLMLLSSNASLTTVEMDANSIALAKRHLNDVGLLDRVTIFAGDAKQIVPQLNGKYDMIFMDGPKSQYIEFLPYLISLLEVGGTLVCDNVLFRGLVANDEHSGRYGAIVRKLNMFLQAITSHEALSSSVIDIGDGISISVRIK